MPSLHFTLFAFFLVIAAVLFNTGLPGIAWVFLAVSLIVAFHWLLLKANSKAGRTAEKTRKGLEKEWDLIEKAKPSVGTGLKFAEEGFRTVGKKAGEAIFAKDGEKYSAPQPISRVSKGSQNFISEFFKIFKKAEK
ncbi:MAG: hypothetical protein J4478_02315 [Candidatus Diapherotrites archaeon]|uniref:Uncharacterized protein n=1 Tax=Candidatus Iainarchaeum sp. TaxID=3101447 RepID=A0A7J4JVN7_9ARCH|nr:hypothetical protein [Candidatus Diapherotrites archaeon]HIH21843.1 hypothetical protein [Candidatus Diapherotrites archaeon]